MELLSNVKPSRAAIIVAEKLIKHAGSFKGPDLLRLLCPTCHNFPYHPITGNCGHTRCKKCVWSTPTCPCGVETPGYYMVNVLVQEMLSKMYPNKKAVVPSYPPNIYSAPVADKPGVIGPMRHRERYRKYMNKLDKKDLIVVTFTNSDLVEEKFKRAYQLLRTSKFLEAAPHFAIVAAAANSRYKEEAKYLLVQIISKMCNGSDPRLLTPDLYRKVRLEFAFPGVNPRDLECVICYNIMRNPITTPCGHTFCKSCLKKVVETSGIEKCPLCVTDFGTVTFTASNETEFVEEILRSVALSNVSDETYEYIPIFTCTVAYPTIACPLLMFDPRFWVYLNIILTSDSRRFGMVAGAINNTYYGTMLEIKDCIKFEDGRSIISTIGVSRFKVLEIDIIRGCKVARVEQISDILPKEQNIVEVSKDVLWVVAEKAKQWYSSLSPLAKYEIENTLGGRPHFHNHDLYLEANDGPSWLWWLTAILPLDWVSQTHMLSTQCVFRRAVMVLRVFSLMDRLRLTPVVPHLHAHHITACINHIVN